MKKKLYALLLIMALLTALVPIGTVGTTAYARTVIDTADAARGGDYTSTATLAAKLNQVFAGKVGLYTDSTFTQEVSAPIGSSVMTSSNNYYIKSQSTGNVMWGSQCYIYANAVYNTLFHEWVRHGEALSVSKIVIAGGGQSFSYDQFVKAGVKCGAYIRTTKNADGSYSSSGAHSMIVLAYDAENISVLEGNADNYGLVRITTRTWADFTNNQLTAKSRYICHVIQPTDAQYVALYGPGSFTVTYDANGGSGAPAAQTKTKGEKLTLSSTKPTRSGYDFLGWAKSKTASAADYQPGSTYSLSTDTTLYAVWRKNSIKITAQPQSASFKAGNTAKFSVTATGDGLSYQWYFKKKSASSWSSWKTAASFTCVTDDTWDGFQAYCVVKDKYGSSVKSNTMTLTLTKTPLAITAQPASATLKSGGTAKFSVAATGDGLSYQWYFKKKSASSWSSWKTVASFTCVTNDTWDGFQAYCVVKDKYGSSVKSNTMTLTMTKTPLAITAQPASANLTSGDTATFSVAAKGDGLSYQWYFKKQDSASWTKWKTSARFTCETNDTWDGFQAYCVVTDKYGSTVKSDTMRLYLKIPLEITEDYFDTFVISGDRALFGVKARGKGLSYQWYYKKKGATSWSKWKTVASFTCVINDTWDGFQAYCVVKDSSGATVTSRTMKMILRTPLSITAQPQSATIKSGDTAKFSITAKGEKLKYQWYFKKKGATSWSKWKTVPSFTCVTNDTWDGFQAYCVLTDDSGATKESNIMTIKFA